MTTATTTTTTPIYDSLYEQYREDRDLRTPDVADFHLVEAVRALDHESFDKLSMEIMGYLTERPTLAHALKVHAAGTYMEEAAGLSLFGETLAERKAAEQVARQLLDTVKMHRPLSGWNESVSAVIVHLIQEVVDAKFPDSGVWDTIVRENLHEALSA